MNKEILQAIAEMASNLKATNKNMESVYCVLLESVGADYADWFKKKFELNISKYDKTRKDVSELEEKIQEIEDYFVDDALKKLRVN